jgi:hypothetical protein
LVEWSLSPLRDGATAVRVRPGGTFQVVARNLGLAAVRVEVDTAQARGVRVSGGAQRRIAPGQSQAIDLAHVPGQELGGALRLRSEDGARAAWWERYTWREKDVPLATRLQIREERWLAGSPRLLFPPGVSTQYFRVWNDAEAERTLRGTSPAGYRLRVAGQDLSDRAFGVPAEGSVELALRVDALAPGNSADALWPVLPGGNPIELIRLAADGVADDADVVVAVDFGTRNTGIRVRWRRTLVPSKPAGTVEAVGDRGDNPRFPTQMVLHLREQSFRWGSDAAEYAQARRMSVDEIAVDNLKTYLREEGQRFSHLRPEWTHEGLLARYFERVFSRLDEYFRTVDPAQPLARAHLRVRYVLTRPVLDANEGDEVGQRYERALLDAAAACGVSEEDVTLVQEPVAAAVGIARRRAEELLALPDGAAVAVVDSGGGTSHVALGRVRLQAGTVSLEVTGSYALRLGDENPAMEAIGALERHGFEGRREVGGNVLDSVLLFGLATEAGRILESEGRPIPSNIWLRAGDRPSPAGSMAAQARVRDIRNIARRMKERFARASTQYLNRAPGAIRSPDEVLPFPHREDLQGIYLVHALYDENVLGPVLDPVVGELGQRIVATRTGGSLIPSDVRRVFYVGGTNVDPFVRQHFGRLFPFAAADEDPESQSDARIAERLNAVVDGAVWYGERLYAPSPLTLVLHTGEREETLIEAGAPLVPEALAAPRFFAAPLQPGEELEARLMAAGGGLPEALEVARGFYRNDTASLQEVVVAATVARERGCVAEVQAPGGRLPLWRFQLAEAGR